jgi:hypothetical protein
MTPTGLSDKLACTAKCNFIIRNEECHSISPPCTLATRRRQRERQRAQKIALWENFQRRASLAIRLCALFQCVFTLISRLCNESCFAASKAKILPFFYYRQEIVNGKHSLTNKSLFAVFNEKNHLVKIK